VLLETKGLLLAAGTSIIFAQVRELELSFPSPRY